MAHKIEDMDGNFNTYPTMLRALERESVFSVEHRKDGMFRVREACDDYFCVYLTREQVLTLADEIRDFVENSG